MTDYMVVAWDDKTVIWPSSETAARRMLQTEDAKYIVLVSDAKVFSYFYEEAKRKGRQQA